MTRLSSVVETVTDLVTPILQDHDFYLYDLKKQVKISNSYSVTGIDEIELKTEENKIKIIRKGNVEETIAIQ